MDEAAESEAAKAFRVEELKLLRHEIEVRSEEQRAMERYVLLADAAIYAVLVFPNKASDKTLDTSVAWIGWYLPGLLAVAALVRWYESVRMIRNIAEYIQRIETKVLGSDNGWENHLFKQRGEVPIAPGLYSVFWLTAAVAPTALAAYEHPFWNLAFPCSQWPAAVTAITVLGLILWPSRN